MSHIIFEENVLQVATHVHRFCVALYWRNKCEICGIKVSIKKFEINIHLFPVTEQWSTQQMILQKINLCIVGPITHTRNLLMTNSLHATQLQQNTKVQSSVSLHLYFCIVQLFIKVYVHIVCTTWRIITHYITCFCISPSTGNIVWSLY